MLDANPSHSVRVRHLLGPFIIIITRTLNPQARAFAYWPVISGLTKDTRWFAMVTKLGLLL